MTDSRKTSGNIIFIDFGMDLTYFDKTVENQSYFLRLEKTGVLKYRDWNLEEEIVLKTSR